jgi:Domain of unknown function (DUF4864)
MQRLLCLALVALLPCLGLSQTEAKPSSQAMKEKLQAAIRGQLECFRKDDFAGAYRFAATGVREQFPLAAFEKMVREGYPVIASSEEAVFGLTLDDGENAVVNVRVVGKNKDSVSYQYLMERDREDWRISGVFLLRENATPI